MDTLWIIHLPADAVPAAERPRCERVLLRAFQVDQPGLKFRLHWTGGNQVQLVSTHPRISAEARRKAEQEIAASVAIFNTAVRQLALLPQAPPPGR